jgi:anhydro-N-acetylmuramic acid kinase
VAGLISGTSVDGIDAAVVDVDDQRLELVAAHTVPYPDAVRQRILAASNRVVHVGEVARLNFLIGELFAEAVQALGVAGLELVGSHGQTIFHEGDAVDVAGRRIASTLQIGEGAVMAARLGVPVYSDFRVGDVAVGGKGAPLVPFFDYRVFRHPTIHRAALNLGGIANVTVIPAGARPEEVVAFDTGPANIVMDQLCPPFDARGDKARQGQVNEALLAELLRDEYYHRPPPKTAGREQYGAEFIARTGIDLTTAAELTARTVAMGLARDPRTQEAIVSGGGAHNNFLMDRLRALIPARILTSADVGVNVDAKEAMLFALLAYEAHRGRAGNIPSATGARRAAVLGKLSRP